MITVLSVNNEKPYPEEQIARFRVHMQRIGATIVDRHWAVEIQIDQNDCFCKGFLFRHDLTAFVIDLISTKEARRRQGAAKSVITQVLAVLDTLSLTCGLDAEDLYTATMPFDDLIAWYERLGFRMVLNNEIGITMRRPPQTISADRSLV